MRWIDNYFSKNIFAFNTLVPFVFTFCDRNPVPGVLPEERAHGPPPVLPSTQEGLYMPGINILRVSHKMLEKVQVL